jgi:MFS transporter, DHA1 family, multidrug resistance protein
MTTARHTPSRESHTPWGLVVLLGTLTAFAPMSIDMYLPSLPALVLDLHTSIDAGQETLAAFFAGLSIGQLLYGPASDRFGRRLPVLLGVSVYVAASIACALAPDIELLIAARFAQALGGCGGIVVARAVVRDRFDHQESARIFSLLTLIMGVAPILAPLLGGLLLKLAGWRAIFALLAVFGALVGLSAHRFLEESRSEAVAARARSEHPIRAYGALLKERRLVGYLLAGGLNGACLFAYISASPDLIIGTYHISPQAFGWVFGTNAFGLIGASQLNRILLRRFHADRVLAAASLISLGFAFLLFAIAVTGLGGMWGVLTSLFLVLASFGFMQANTMAGALSVDPLRAGSTSALMGASSFACGALAASLVGLLHDGTPRPLALVMLGSLAGCAVALFGLALRKVPAQA